MSDDLSPTYKAQSQSGLLYALFAIPIPLEVGTTTFRLWVKRRRTTSRRLAFDDYLMIFATVGGATAPLYAQLANACPACVCNDMRHCHSVRAIKWPRAAH